MFPAGGAAVGRSGTDLERTLAGSLPVSLSLVSLVLGPRSYKDTHALTRKNDTAFHKI